MATIPPYVDRQAHVGQEIAVKAKKVVWFKVGEGNVRAFSNFEVYIGGKLKFMTYDGDLDIHLTLLDQDPAAQSGPCRLRLNKHQDDAAKYRATRDTLTVFATLGGKKQNVAIRRTDHGKQTECELFGHVNETVHLDPT